MVPVAVPLHRPDGMARGGFFSVESLKGVHVLVVNDDRLARELVLAALQYCGAFVLTAPSAPEALRMIGIIKPDAVVTTLGLPGDDGIDLLDQMRVLTPGDERDIPVVAIGTDAGVRERVLSRGFQAYLTWPLNPWELCRAIASLAAIG
jgi:CheY-like chemotaxis protein